jgi:hypothetical protein
VNSIGRVDHEKLVVSEVFVSQEGLFVACHSRRRASVHPLRGLPSRRLSPEAIGFSYAIRTGASAPYRQFFGGFTLVRPARWFQGGGSTCASSVPVINRSYFAMTRPLSKKICGGFGSSIAGMRHRGMR